MIACIWGETTHLEETVSTLRLASRMMRVQNETVAVETIDPSALIKKQEKIIKALKQELLMHDALIERTGTAYDPYTPEQQDSVSQMLEKYVEAPEIEEENILNITNYRQMLEICKQFKKKLLNARMEAKLAQEQSLMGYNPSNNKSRGNNAAFDGSNINGDIDYSADSKIVSDYNPNAPLVGESSNNAKMLGFSLGFIFVLCFIIILKNKNKNNYNNKELQLLILVHMVVLKVFLFFSFYWFAKFILNINCKKIAKCTALYCICT
jgi:kinesin family protein 6/9